MQALELGTQLSQFTGTEQWYRHGLVPAFLYTDGTQYFAENAGGGAYWLLDIIATEVLPLQHKHPFISISFDVDDDGTADIYATDGNDVALWSKHIDITDSPAGQWNFYLIDNILLLTSEY